MSQKIDRFEENREKIWLLLEPCDMTFIIRIDALHIPSQK